jgi:hypothetical protein
MVLDVNLSKVHLQPLGIMVSPFQSSLFRIIFWLTAFHCEVVFKEIFMGATVPSYFLARERLLPLDLSDRLTE